MTWNVARPVWRRVWEPREERIFSRAGGPRHSLLVGPERIATVRQALHGAENEIVLAATRRLEGHVTVLGHPELTLRSDSAYDRDPLSGTQWPDRHGRLIDYRLAKPGDPKLIWELDRCQELPLLAVATTLTGDPRFADEAAARLHSWITHHRPGRGIAWANAFEPAMRVLSLALAFDALRAHPLLLSSDVRSDVVRGLWQHGRWIVGDLSRFTSANNHLVGELAGMLALTVLVPELNESDRWREQAIEELSREASLQILPDGSGAEQSFSYWLFTVDLFLTCAALLEAARVACPEPIMAALTRAADTLAVLVNVDEPEPAFGDADNGRVLVFDGMLDRTARGVAASLAAYLGHGGMRRLAGTVDATAAILFGPEGLARFDAADVAEAPGDALLTDGGLVVLRRAGTRTLCDVGPLGYLDIAAHGHADALQVVVSRGKEELVCDPGTGSYLGNPELRRRLRGTAAHATVCVDRQDQSQQGGPFLWTRHARTRLLTCDLREGVVIGEHDGYAALPDPVTHRRATIALGDGATLVIDRLAGAAEHTYDQTWPLAPALEPHEHERLAGVVVASSPRGTRIVLALASTPTSQIVLDGSGCWSRRLEQTEQAWIVLQRLTARDAVHLGAVLFPVGDPTACPEPTLELAVEGHECFVTVDVTGRARQRFRVVLASPGPASVRREGA